MRNFNNTINYFFQKFYNNLKYSNRILFSLRIFFERTTKSTNIVSWLGNVYRNSKWSSLNIQNIKASFKYQFLSIFFLYLSVLIVLYMFRHNISILQFFVFTPSYFWYIIQDWLSYSSLLFLSFFYLFIQKTDMLFSTLIPNFFLSVGNNHNKQINTVVLGKNCITNKGHTQNLNSQLCVNKTFLDLTFTLQKTVNILNLTNYSYQVDSENYLTKLLRLEKLNYNKKDLVSKFFILTNDEYNLEERRDIKISRNELKYKLLSLGSPNTSFTTTTYLKLNSLLKYDFKLQKIAISNLSKNLVLAKENRWLWKNSLISDKILVNVNKSLHFKKLVSNPEFNEAIVSNNIWGSNRIKYNFDFLKSNSINYNEYLKFFSNSFSSPLNLNKYEDSLIWSTKRFTFTQKMNYNNQFIFSQNKFSLDNKNGNKITFTNLLFNKFYYNYNNTNSFVSFYKLILNTNSSLQSGSNNNLTLINTTNKELLNNNDNFFVKLIVSNVSFNKNEIVFYSII